MSEESNLLKRSYIVALDSAHFLAATIFVRLFYVKKKNENFWNNQREHSMTNI